jgi:hypothetical protein
VNLFAGEIWPFVALAAVLAIALVAKWLRGSAVEDPHEAGSTTAGSPDDSDVELEQDEGADDESGTVDDAVEEGEEGEEDQEGDDELAPLGVSPDDRLEFLERLAERGAIALLWTAADPKLGSSFVQHAGPGGTTTMPMFTSEAKALRYARAIGPRAMGMIATYEPMPVDAAFLVEGDFDVVVNPRTLFATTLTSEDRGTLGALAGVEEREPGEIAGDDEALAELAGDDDGEPATNDDDDDGRAPIDP